MYDPPVHLKTPFGCGQAIVVATFIIWGGVLYFALLLMFQALFG